MIDAGRRVVYCAGCERPAAWHGPTAMRQRGWSSSPWRCADCAPRVPAQDQPTPATIAASLGIRTHPYPGGYTCDTEHDAMRLAREVRRTMGVEHVVARTGVIITATLRAWAA